MHCPTDVAGNRLDLEMTDVPDILDLFIGTSLGTLDHCFVSCELCVKEYVPEYNVRSTVFLKHHPNWHNVHCAVRSFTWNTILKLADPPGSASLSVLAMRLVCFVLAVV